MAKAGSGVGWDGLIFADFGRESGVFSNEIYAGMAIVIAPTTILFF